MLSAQNRNFIVDLTNWSEAMLEQRDEAAMLQARWNQNGIGAQLTDEDIQAVFPHLTAGEVTNAINAVNAVLAALGDYTSGQAVNLVKLKG